MPTYEFRCPNGHDFEKFYRSIGSAPVEVRCPECREVAVRQLSAGGGLLFKGSGFYITDYGKDGKKDQAKQPVKTEGGGVDKSESGGEASKPAEAKSADSGSASASESKPASTSTESPGSSPGAGATKPAAPPASTKPSGKK